MHVNDHQTKTTFCNYNYSYVKCNLKASCCCCCCWGQFFYSICWEINPYLSQMLFNLLLFFITGLPRIDAYIGNYSLGVKYSSCHSAHQRRMCVFGPHVQVINSPTYFSSNLDINLRIQLFLLAPHLQGCFTWRNICASVTEIPY